MAKNVRASRGKIRLTNGHLLVWFEIDQYIAWSKTNSTEIEICMSIDKAKVKYVFQNFFCFLLIEYLMILDWKIKKRQYHLRLLFGHAYNVNSV